MTDDTAPVDPCAGPNHGNDAALPRGHRQWAKGHCLSLTQEIKEEGLASQATFCSPDCMCDWHGAFAAHERDMQDAGEDFSIPGTFVLVWIVPESTTIGKYATFDDLTAKIGDYQQRLMARIDPI